MSEEEMQNKIRLNEARRGDSAEKSLDNSNKVKPSVGDGKKAIIKNNDSSSKNKESNGLRGKFAKIAVPLAAIKKAKDIVTAPTKVQVTDVPIYGIAFALALFKDLLDLAFIGSLPAIGTVITFCISMAIGFVLLFDGVSNYKRKVVRNMMRRWLVLIGGTIAEGVLFGLNFMPIETLVVGIIYWMALVDRKKSVSSNNE